jgi:hypothetical protein
MTSLISAQDFYLSAGVDPAWGPLIPNHRPLYGASLNFVAMDEEEEGARRGERGKKERKRIGRRRGS